MIGRRSTRKPDIQEDKPKGFDDFDLRLGDVMRGERATLGKSLLDVQRELRIKASYIAAIENCDPESFDTPGFIAGYVRSYARYLGMDPDLAFEAFCYESGFSVAHGMSAQASSIRKPTDEPRRPVKAERDIFAQPSTPFAPKGASPLAGIEPGAIGSLLVLIALIGGIGYGGYSVLKEVQRVQLAPVEQSPVILSELDPLEGATVAAQTAQDPVRTASGFVPQVEAMDRLYRPPALDVPVLVSRDAPISTLDPRSIGTFAGLDVDETDTPPVLDTAPAIDLSPNALPVPQVLAQAGPSVQMVAVRPAWVRVRAADGSVIFEGIMDGGDTWEVPATEEPPSLRVGESGAIYFAVNGQHYGPAGPSGTITANVALSVENLTDAYSVADLQADGDLARTVAQLAAQQPPDQ